jgi:uncharacterized protein YjdB
MVAIARVGRTARAGRSGPASGQALLLASVLLASAAACTTAVDPVPVAVVSLSPGIDSVEVGASAVLFVPTLRDRNGTELTGRTIIWTSTNSTIATVDASGRVQGVAVGQTTITAASDGKSAQATVKVLLPIASVVVTPDSVEIALTQTRSVIAQLVGPAGEAISNRTISWASMNPAIATVNSVGTITPLTVGTTTVTASAGTKSATVKVVVKGEPVTLVRIFPNDPVQIVRLTGTRSLSAVCYNLGGTPLTGREVTWASNNPAIAPVSSTGLVTGLALGQANITATCEGPSATVTVQVTPIPVSSVAITPGQLQMFVGQQQQLTATPRDSANNVLSLQGRQIVWSSDNLPVATVSAAGVAAGVSAGNAQIQVTVDGVASPAINVAVQNVPVATVQITPNPGAVQCNSVLPLNATLRDASGNVLSGRVITWRSLNTNLATVSLTGIVTGVGLGQVTIEAESEGIIGNALITVNQSAPPSC